MPYGRRDYRLSARRCGEDGGSPFPMCYENHAQDSRVRGPINAAPTFGHSNANSMGVSGNNPLILQFKRANKEDFGMNPPQSRRAADRIVVTGAELGPVPRTRVIGVDGYNKTVTDDIVSTISGAASDFHHTHGAIILEGGTSVRQVITFLPPKYAH